MMVNEQVDEKDIQMYNGRDKDALTENHKHHVKNWTDATIQNEFKG